MQCFMCPKMKLNDMQTFAASGIFKLQSVMLCLALRTKS